MTAIALRNQAPLLKLSARALAILLSAGMVFLLMRFYRLSGKGESFPFLFETSRMLINFGSMALLSPIAYLASAQAIKRPKSSIVFLVLGLLIFALAYLLLNKSLLWLIGNGGLSFDFVKGSKKLLLNFGHILVICYGALLYGSTLLLRKREQQELIDEEKAPTLQLKIDGLEKTVLLSEIHYIKADDHYLRLYYQGGFHLVRSSVSDMQQKLSGDFVQIHRSTIINSSHLAKVMKKEGRLWVYLNDGSSHRVSASFKRSVLDLNKQL